MPWATRRRFIILLIVGAVVVAFLTVVLISVFYKTPSCTDGIQNQDEESIDCGGSCPYLCTAQQQPPTVLFTKVISNGAGRTDVIAMVENKNITAAAKNVPYKITFYGSDRSQAGEINGAFDLPPGATEPIYVLGVGYGKKVTSAFLNIDPSAPMWFAMATDLRTVPTVLKTARKGTSDAPIIEAVLANSSAVPLTNVQSIIMVHNKHNDIIAVSKTVVSIIPAQGQAVATFTWNSAFSSTPALIEVVPIIPLP